MSATSTHINKEKKQLNKIKERKTEIIATSIVIGTVIAGILIYKKVAPKELVHIKDNVPYTSTEKSKLPSPESTIQTISNIIDFSEGKTSIIPGHPRTLPYGYKASEKQLELAKNLGVTLAENQTYVRDYPRRSA